MQIDVDLSLWIDREGCLGDGLHAMVAAHICDFEFEHGGLRENGKAKYEPSYHGKVKC